MCAPLPSFFSLIRCQRARAQFDAYNMVVSWRSFHKKRKFVNAKFYSTLNVNCCCWRFSKSTEFTLIHTLTMINKTVKMNKLNGKPNKLNGFLSCCFPILISNHVYFIQHPVNARIYHHLSPFVFHHIFEHTKFSGVHMRKKR